MSNQKPSVQSNASATAVASGELLGDATAVPTIQQQIQAAWQKVLVIGEKYHEARELVLKHQQASDLVKYELQKAVQEAQMLELQQVRKSQPHVTLAQARAQAKRVMAAGPRPRRISA